MNIWIWREHCAAHNKLIKLMCFYLRVYPCAFVRGLSIPLPTLEADNVQGGHHYWNLLFGLLSLHENADLVIDNLMNKHRMWCFILCSLDDEM